MMRMQRKGRDTSHTIEECDSPDRLSCSQDAEMTPVVAPSVAPRRERKMLSRHANMSGMKSAMMKPSSINTHSVWKSANKRMVERGEVKTDAPNATAVVVMLSEVTISA